MTTKVGVKRCFRGSGGMDNSGNYEFARRPAKGEIVWIGGLAEGTVQRVEHGIALSTPSGIAIFC